jgi:outer membrane receptor protein involved in Fe transport
MTLAAIPPALAQTAPAAATTADAANQTEEEVVVLSPFVVSASGGETGYGVKDTLAGTRVRTELKDISSSISVVNSQFLKDTGARNNQDLLVYTTNTEVAGLGGNFSGQGSYISGTYQTDFAKPNTETRVRGVDSADNTRDYFSTDIPWDSYNVDRVDLQRGPNSILFGVGSPAGIVNTSTNGASFKTGGKLETRFGSFGSFRSSFDYNHVLLDNQLALRVSLLDDDTKYRQEPAYNRTVLLRRVAVRPGVSQQGLGQDLYQGELRVR